MPLARTFKGDYPLLNHPDKNVNNFLNNRAEGLIFCPIVNQ